MKFGGGPVGLSTVAAAVGEETDTVEDVVEPCSNWGSCAGRRAGIGHRARLPTWASPPLQGPFPCGRR